MQVAYNKKMEFYSLQPEQTMSLICGIHHGIFSAGMATTEELIYNRFILFINKHIILTDDRYGYRDKISTQMANQFLIENIQESIDKQLYIVKFIF